MYKIAAITILLAVALLLSACAGESSVPDEVYQALDERGASKDSVTNIHKADVPGNFRAGAQRGAEEVWCAKNANSQDPDDDYVVRRIGTHWQAYQLGNMIPDLWNLLEC